MAKKKFKKQYAVVTDGHVSSAYDTIVKALQAETPCLYAGDDEYVDCHKAEVVEVTYKSIGIHKAVYPDPKAVKVKQTKKEA